MIDSTQTTNTGTFSFIAVLLFMLLSRKILNRRDKITENVTGKLLQNYG